MTSAPSYSSTLQKHLMTCSQQEFTGVLDVKSQNGDRWYLRFFLGRIVGDAGGLFPTRRWYRQIRQFASGLSSKDISFPSGNHERSWSHHFLGNLLSQGLVERSQAVSILQNSIVEVLLDITLAETQQQFEGTAPTYVLVAEDDIELEMSPLVPLKVEYLWDAANRLYNDWVTAGLVDIHPSATPTIGLPQHLQEQVSAGAYQRLSSLLDSKRTLRDIALSLGQDLLTVTRSLMPYIKTGIIRLERTLDLSKRQESVKRQPGLSQNTAAARVQPITYGQPVSSRNNVSSNQPLSNLKRCSSIVAYVDDSPLDTKLMQKVVSRFGLGTLCINDPLLALPQLLENPPGIIFLDLVMPVVNGYEICTQVRRVSILKDIPVVMVTSSDGVINRMRAKLVGATGFISKPIKDEEIIPVLSRYLLDAGTVSTQMGQSSFGTPPSHQGAL